MSVNNSNFNSVSFKAAFHANPGADRNFARSKWLIFKHSFPKFSETSVKSNVSLLK